LALSTLSPWHEHLDDNQTSSIRSWSKLGTTEGRVMFKFPPAIIIFCRLQKYFNKKDRVKQSIDFGIFKGRLPAYDHDIGIGVKSCGTKLDPHVAGIHFTWTLSQLCTQFGANIQGNKAMPPASASHGKHFSLDILAFVWSFALKRENSSAVK
jgi:hypothetical protein